MASMAAAAPGSASGSATYTAKAGPVRVTFTHAYLVKGPDAASGAIVRRLVLATKDVTAALEKCNSMMCSDGGIEEGMTVDLGGPRLNYWFVANGQLVQYSGNAPTDAASLATDTPTHVTGALHIDDRAAGGPKVDVEFDASLVKELAAP